MHSEHYLFRNKWVKSDSRWWIVVRWKCMEVMGDYGDDTPKISPDLALLGMMDTAHLRTPELLWV